MSMTPRIGILGGTFDPIHLGHLEAASAARRALSLDRVLLLPARTPPHRSTEPRASVFHRFAMAALAAAERRHAGLRSRAAARGAVVHGVDARGAASRRVRAVAAVSSSPAAMHSPKSTRGTTIRASCSLANFVVVSRPGAPRASDLIPNPQSLIPGSGRRSCRWRPILRTCPPPRSVAASAPANRSTGSCRRASPAISAGITCTCRRQ